MYTFYNNLYVGNYYTYSEKGGKQVPRYLLIINNGLTSSQVVVKMRIKKQKTSVFVTLYNSIFVRLSLLSQDRIVTVN